jgi:hypothetical protein
LFSRSLAIKLPNRIVNGVNECNALLASIVVVVVIA